MSYRRAPKPQNCRIDLKQTSLSGAVVATLPVTSSRKPLAGPTRRYRVQDLGRAVLVSGLRLKKSRYSMWPEGKVRLP
jgi:hypothetical protein